MDQNRTKIALTFTGALLAGIVVLIAMSFQAIEPTEWAISYHKLYKSLDKGVLEGGRHLVGPFYELINFPATYETIEFSTEPNAKGAPLRTRTKDGLLIVIHLSFQYQLIKEKLGDLYDLANVEYETTFKRIARDVILQQAGDYKAGDYWVTYT
jgi:hypothetical protein